MRCFHFAFALIFATLQGCTWGNISENSTAPESQTPISFGEDVLVRPNASLELRWTIGTALTNQLELQISNPLDSAWVTIQSPVPNSGTLATQAIAAESSGYRLRLILKSNANKELFRSGVIVVDGTPPALSASVVGGVLPTSATDALNTVVASTRHLDLSSLATDSHGVIFEITALPAHGAIQCSTGLNCIYTPSSTSSTDEFSLMAKDRAGNLSSTVRVQFTTSTTTTFSPLAGVIDTTFATAGVFTNSFDQTDGAFMDGIPLSDNTYLVSGIIHTNYNPSVCIVIKLNNDGSLESSFGTTGVARIPFVAPIDSGVPTEACTLQGMATDSNGKIYVTGYQSSGGNLTSLFIARLTTSGQLDATFGTAGVKALSPTTSDIKGSKVQVDASDRPVVVGENNGAGIVYRFTTSGALDTSFGDLDGAGPARLGSFTDANLAMSRDLYVNSIGILVVGAASTYQSIHLRLTSNGVLDSSFGTGGIRTRTTTVAGGALDIATGLLWSDSTSEMFSTGLAQNASGGLQMFVSKYASNGALDTSFGSSGDFTSLFGSTAATSNFYATSLLKEASGKTLANLFSVDGAQVATRLNTDGTLDTSFATSGLFSMAQLRSNKLVQGADGKGLLIGEKNSKPTLVRIK